ncbi:hypothetical protein V2J09_017479 [Rumex salicifolius]
MEMQEPKVLTVAIDGDAGAYKTVQEAVDAVPLKNTSRTVIRVSPGVYSQPIVIPKTKNFITLCGVSTAEETTDLIGRGTFGCGSVIVEGEDFIAENITFENSSPQGSHQAVALRASSDRCAFYNCRFLGWQDTLYLHYGRHYLRDCYIEGDVDFIFGNSTALFENCQIHCKSEGFITAQNRHAPEETTAYVFLRCVITGDGRSSYTYLGRPWGPYGRVLFAFTHIDHCIKPEGWSNWDESENKNTACFYQYRCTGPGSSTSNRVSWCKELKDDEARPYLAHVFIDSSPQEPWLLQKMAIRIPSSA